MKKSIIKSLLITLSFPLLAGIDREFIFDIHDATSTTEQYHDEAIIVPVYQTSEFSLLLSDAFAGELPGLYTQLPTLLNNQGFSASDTHIAAFSDTDTAGHTFTIIASGLGVSTSTSLPLEAFRRCFGRALLYAEEHNIETVHIALPSCIDATMKEIAQEIAAVTYTALYEYTALKPTKTLYGVKRICVHAHMQTPQDFKDVNIGLRIGSNFGNSLCQAREWINTPAHLKTPTLFAADLAHYVLPYIAKIETIIFEKEDIIRMGMGGLLGAAQGSDEPCTFVVHYMKSRYPKVPTITLIGNGITGGNDASGIGMSGASIVCAALNIVAYRNIPVNIAVITPLAEHTSSDTSLKVGDILCMSNRKTVEIGDANAVGQLMLADAVTHTITHHHPDCIIDIATLTDACKQTFGGSYAAIMGNNEDLIKRAQQAALRTGESVWQLPLSLEYTARLKSESATLCNAPLQDRTAQTQTAGCFLQQFVGNTPWLHIDIAGANTAREYTAHGAPAFGVRLLIDMIESLAYDHR